MGVARCVRDACHRRVRGCRIDPPRPSVSRCTAEMLPSVGGARREASVDPSSPHAGARVVKATPAALPPGVRLAVWPWVRTARDADPAFSPSLHRGIAPYSPRAACVVAPGLQRAHAAVARARGGGRARRDRRWRARDARRGGGGAIVSPGFHA